MADIKNVELLKPTEVKQEAPVSNDPRLVPVGKMDIVSKEIELEEKYGDQPLKAIAAGAARGATFGISDQLLTKLGIVDKQTLRELEERNRTASTVGEVAGIVGPSLVPGLGIAGAGVKAASEVGKIAEKVTEKTLKSIISSTGNKALATKIIEKSLPRIAGSAVEGSFYGAGQLISEEALGTAEFNAENLLASVGTGALLGGLAGGAFGATEALVPVLKKGSSKIVEKVESYLDPEEAALELIGTTSAKKLKLKKTNPDVIKELPDFLKNKAELGIFTTDRKLFESLDEIKSNASEKINSILTDLESLYKTNPTISPTKKSIYTKIVSDLDNNFINKYAKSPAYKNELRPIKSLRNEYSKLADEEGFFTPIELNTLRKQLDEVIKYNKIPGTRTLLEEANIETRKLLRKEIDDIADRASSVTPNANLLAELKSANKDYRIATTVMPFVEGKLEQKKLLSLMDFISGGALIGAFKEAGLALAATKKFAESDIARKLKILTQIEKSNQKINNKIESSVSKYLLNPRQTIKPSSVNILLNTDYARKNFSGSKPQDKQEAFKNVKENIEKMSANPDILLERLVKNTLRLNKHVPNTNSQLEIVINNAFNFLQSKLPKDPRPQGAFDIFRRPWQPSSIELAKFERYLEAVEHPSKILDDLENGSVTPEAIEVLKNIYPDMYGRIQKTVINKVSSNPNTLSYDKRVQLGLLLNISADSSLTPRNIQLLQSSFKTEEEPEMRMSGIDKIDKNNVATPIERTLTRE